MTDIDAFDRKIERNLRNEFGSVSSCSAVVVSAWQVSMP
jgi:hypothetical protein